MDEKDFEDVSKGRYMSMIIPEDRRVCVLDYDQVIEQKRKEVSIEKNEKDNEVWILALPCQGWQEVYEPACIPVRIRKSITSDVIICTKRK